MKLTNELLRDKYEVAMGRNGQYIIFSKDQNRQVKISTSETKHKYGKTMAYQYVSYRDEENKYHTTTLQRFIWTYFNGDIPEKYDVDHINNDSLDNRVENLQLLTRKENLRKRGKGRNHYVCIKEQKNNIA